MSPRNTPRDYPYKGWVLMPSFRPVEVEFVRGYQSWSNQYYGDFTSKDKLISHSLIFPTEIAAIEFGHQDLDGQQAKLDAMQGRLLKRRSALVKAAGETK